MFHSITVPEDKQKNKRHNEIFGHTSSSATSFPWFSLFLLGNEVASCGSLRERLGRFWRLSVYTFCLINISLSLSDDANKIKTLNIERA